MERFTVSWKSCSAIHWRDVIEAEDVEAVTTEQTTNKIFEMVNAIAEHNQRERSICIMIC